MLIQDVTDEEGFFLTDGVLVDEGTMTPAIDATMVERLWKMSEELVNQSV
jgi:hypothetical protein